jgi:uncharacterized membrane protein (DUF485 family)
MGLLQHQGRGYCFAIVDIPMFGFVVVTIYVQFDNLMHCLNHSISKA